MRLLANSAVRQGYRGLISRKLADSQPVSQAQSSLTLHSSEFSLPSAMATVAPIKNLVTSGDQKQRKIGQHLLKTAAIMQSISTQSLPFELKTTPEATAMR